MRSWALSIDIEGLEFALLAADHDITGTRLDKALFRPGALVFDMDGVKHRIRLSWGDGLPHEDVLVRRKK